MAISLVTQTTPSQFESAYRPITWEWSSDRTPNLIPGESYIAISEIRKPNAAELATYSDLDASDVLMVHAAFGTSLVVGDKVKVELTDNGYYSGVYRVAKVIDTIYTVLDTTDNGGDTGGFVSYYYANHTVFVRVGFEASTREVILKLKPNSANRFSIDLSDVLRSYLQRTMDGPATPGDAVGSVDASYYLGGEYGLVVWEGYDVPDANGLPVFTEFKDAGETLSFKEWYVVNSVHPFSHTSGLNYEDTYADYIVTSTASTTQKFLTLAPVEPDLPYNPALDQFCIRIGSNDDYFLSYLWKGSATTIKVAVIQYQTDGTLISLTYTNTTSAPTVGTVSCGPRVLSLDPSCKYYRVFLTNFGSGGITKTGLFYLDDTCTGQKERFYWQNKLGGVDAYTLYGKKAENNSVARSIVQAGSMTPSARGGYNRRTYRVEPQRTVSLTTQLLSPEVMRWLGEDMMESVDIRVNAYDTAWAPVIITSDTTPISIGRDYQRGRMTFDYTLGVDNRSHRG